MSAFMRLYRAVERLSQDAESRAGVVGASKLEGSKYINNHIALDFMSSATTKPSCFDVTRYYH